MKLDFRGALARLVPLFMPELLFRLGTDGRPVFKEFAAAITPTEFLPGKIFGSDTLQPIDYLVAMAEGRIKPPSNLDIATIQQQQLANTFRLHLSQYLMRRALDWKAKGFAESLATWQSLNSRSKFWGADQRAAFKNWQDLSDPRNPLDGRQGVNERIMLRELLRRVDMMVILENKLDALVRLHTPWPPGLIGHPHQYDIPHNLTPESAVRAKCRVDRSAGARRLRNHRLRSGVFALGGRHALCLDALSKADQNSGAWAAFLACVPGRAGQRGCPFEDRVGLRSGIQAPHTASGLWSARPDAKLRNERDYRRQREEILLPVQSG